jgi:predicted transcriptional regulator
MRALSIRQPYAELILRGIKPIEFRSRPTTIIGERFYIYASRQWARGKLYLEGCRPKPEESVVSGPLSVVKKAWSDDLAIPGANAPEGMGSPEPWMLNLAQMLILNDLPTGVIVGSAVIEKVTQGTDFYEWHLSDIERAKKLRKPKGHPQPVWFTPF